jgi:hypothetical protein
LKVVVAIISLVICQVKITLVEANKLRLLGLHTWLESSLTLVAHTALEDDDFGEVSVNLVPAVVAVAV